MSVMMQSVADRIGRPVPTNLRLVRGDEATAPLPRTARPVELSQFIGQDDVVFNLIVECEAAKMDDRPPDHTLLEGPAGLGKTSLAHGMAHEMGYRVVEIPATALGKVGDAADALASIGSPGDSRAIVVVDEIQETCKKGFAYFLSALEDGWFQPSGKPKFYLPEFCLVAATTDPGALPRPLLDRFAVRESLEYYPHEHMVQIIRRYADAQGYAMDDEAVDLIASVGRGTPRVANGIVRRVARFVRVSGESEITAEGVQSALDRLGVDSHGLEKADRAILDALCGAAQPVGVQALAAQLGIEPNAVTNREPYMMRIGAIQRTTARVATKRGYAMLNKWRASMTPPRLPLPIPVSAPA